MHPVIYETPQLLDFISDADLIKCVQEVIDRAIITSGENKLLYSNALDPFSAVFDASTNGLTLESWLQLEKARQKQKTLQNAIGEFHENIIGSMLGWEKLPVGNVIDVVNEEKKIIAEIKNKYNTTKGSDKKALYDNIKKQLSEKYLGYTGYYVEVIPNRAKRYDLPFAPSDNTTKKHRPRNPKIRVIDGYSFYALASGKADALHELYKVLPKIIATTLNRPEIIKMSAEELFITFFHKAFEHPL